MLLIQNVWQVMKSGRHFYGRSRLTPYPPYEVIAIPITDDDVTAFTNY